MALDSRFLSILCCPVSKRALRTLSRTRMAFVNDALLAGNVHNVAGLLVTAALTEALITEDDKVIYRIDDGVPVLLPEEGIGITQFRDFPA
jgi:uncharacterized protein